MKKNIFITMIMSIAVFFNCFALPASAVNEEKTISSSVEYFDDGSCLVTTITEEITNSRASTKTGNKTTTYRDADGNALWAYKITGTFSYTGSSSSCTAVSDSYAIYNDDWHMSSHSCSKSGNTAYGTVTMKRKFLGVTTDTITKNVSLSCSASGTLS
ncbi:MAG: hypothetical protein J6A57_03195 [Ruminococcus sp.]|nr:hypothetical protein [Ruminococcus sp.]